MLYFVYPDSAITALMWVSGNGGGGRGREKHQPPEWVCTPTALLHVGGSMRHPQRSHPPQVLAWGRQDLLPYTSGVSMDWHGCG